jgi:hypothetical protein
MPLRMFSLHVAQIKQLSEPKGGEGKERKGRGKRGNRGRYGMNTYEDDMKDELMLDRETTDNIEVNGDG